MENILNKQKFRRGDTQKVFYLFQSGVLWEATHLWYKGGENFWQPPPSIVKAAMGKPIGRFIVNIKAQN